MSTDVVLDLRANAREQGIEIAAETLLYTIAPRGDIGSSGPYFTEPGRALYWGFHVILATRKDLPATTRSRSQDNTTWARGSVATSYFFPTGEMVLLEIKIDRRIIFSNYMLDSNPYAYVNYRYGAHDPVSLPVQVNLDDKNITLVMKSMCKEHSWSQPVVQKVMYYGLMAMIPIGIFKGAQPADPPRWVVTDNQNRLDVNGSLNQLSAIFRSMDDSVMMQKEAYHETVVETGIRICRPAEVIKQRSYFNINWENMWLSFIGLLSQGATSAVIKEYYVNNVMQLITPVRINLETERVMMEFDRLVFARIVSWCSSICDVLAFCSVNRRMRNSICPLPIVQKILRLKFMPRMNNFFTVLPHRNTPEREDLLGFPTKSSGHHWWKIGSVLFAEDFNEIDDIGHLGAKSTQETTALNLDVDPDKPLTKVQSHLLARFGSAEENFATLELPSSAIAPIVRSCNSFIAMFAMLYSMNNFDPVPRSARISINIADDHGTINLLNTVTASMPSEAFRAAGANPLELLTARPSASYREAVRRITVSGSWLHDNGTPYFFLDPTFASHLDKAKAFELQRYEIASHMLDPTKRSLLTSQHLQIAKMFLTNELRFYKESMDLITNQPIKTMVASIRCSMRGGFQPAAKRGMQYQVSDVTLEDHVMMFFGAVSDDADFKLRNPILHQAYQNRNGAYEYSVFDVDRTTSWSRSNIDGQSVTDLFGPRVFGIQIGLCKCFNVDDRYYAAYMAISCIIRILLRDGCTQVEWITNF